MKKSHYVSAILTLVTGCLLPIESAHAQRPQATQPQVSLAQQEYNRLTREQSVLDQEGQNMLQLKQWQDKRIAELTAEQNTIERTRSSVTNAYVDQFNRRVRAYNVALSQFNEWNSNAKSRANAYMSRENRLKADIASYNQRYNAPKTTYDSMPKGSGDNKLTYDENAQPSK